MSIALVTSTHAILGPNGGTTSGIDTTGANFIVVAVADLSSQGPQTPSDNKSNGSPTGLTEQVADLTRCKLWYFTNPTVGASHTFTYSGTGCYASISVYAFSGVKTSSPADQQNGAGNATGVTSRTTGSVTPSEDNELLFAAAAFQASISGQGIDSSFTAGSLDNFGNGNNFGLLPAYQIQTTGTTRNPTFSWTGGSPVAARIATFKAATISTYTAATAVSAGSMTCAATATNTVPVYHGTGAVAAQPMTSAASATFAPKRTATGAAVASAMACAATAAFSQATINSYSAKFGPNKWINAGTGYQNNFNVSWSLLQWFKQLRVPSTDYSAVPVGMTQASTDPNYPAWVEWFVFNAGPSFQGVLCARIISAWNTRVVSVYGSTVVSDGQPHVAGITWNGSGLASGALLYLDKVLETLNVELNNLASGSTVTADPLIIGNQVNNVGNSAATYYFDNLGPTYFWQGVVKDAAFFAGIDVHDQPPTPTGTTFCYLYRNITGTTIADSSGNNNNATANDSSRGSRFRYDLSVKNRRKPRATPQQNTSGAALTLSLAVTAGDLIIVKAATSGGSGTTVTIADGVNSYSTPSYATNGTQRCTIVSAVAQTTATLSIVVTPSQSTAIQAFAEHYSGPWPASPRVSSGGSTGDSGTPTAGPASVAGIPGQLIVSVAMQTANSTSPVQGDAWVYEGRLNQSGMTSVSQQAFRDEDTETDFDGTWSAPWVARYAVFAPSQPTAATAITSQPMTCAAVASAFFTGPTRFASVACDAQSMSCAAAAQRTVPTFTAAAACTARSMTCHAVVDTGATPGVTDWGEITRAISRPRIARADPR